MKKILSLLMGMTFVLTFGLAFAEDSVTDTGDTNDKMIRNDDLLNLKLDPDRATVNQMPSESSAEGSAAGGVSSESESMGTDIEQSKTPADKGPAESGAEEPGTGGATKDTEGRYDDRNKGQAPVDKGIEGSGAGGTGEGGANKDTGGYK